MTKLLIFISFLILSISLNAFQSDSLIISKNTYLKIDSLEIRGNESTEEFVILRELTFKIGETVNGETITYNRERVYSLGIFNTVEFYVIQKININILVIDVQESWYIYPIPFVKFRKDGLKDASYGMNFIYKNFRGRNEVLQLLFSFGYDPTFGVNYYNPLINEEHQLNLRLAAAYQKMSNKSDEAEVLYGKEFDYDFYGGSILLGKRLNQFNNIYLVTGYQRYKSPKTNISRVTASGNEEDHSLMLGVQYGYDSRDLAQFAKEGVFFSAQLLHKGFGLRNISYNVFEMDFREYRNLIGQINGKWRIANRQTFGKLVPYYDLSYLGYEEYVRGHRRENREGNNYFLMSFEIYHPILDEWTLSLDLPLIPKKLTTARIGIQLNLFADTGIAYNNGERWNINNFLSGYGVGLTFLFLPYNSIRFEYALNEYREGEFLIGTGFSF